MVNQLNQIAYGHVAKKEYDKALLVLTKSLDLCQTYTPSQHFLSEEELEGMVVEAKKRPLPAKYMIWTLVALSGVYQSQSNVMEAKSCFEKALLIGGRIYKETDAPKLDLMLKAGEFYYKKGDTQVAKELFLSVLQLNKKALGSVGRNLAIHAPIANYFLGLMELNAENYVKALALLEDSWSQHRTVIGAKDIRTIRVIAALGKTYAALGDYTKARELVEFAGSIFTTKQMVADVEPLVELHKEIISHIPGAKGVFKITPTPTRHGLKVPEQN